MGLLNLKLRQENVVNITRFHIITKYLFNVLKSNCLIMIVMRICILITSFIQNVAIAPSVQPSSPRQTVLPTQRHQLSCISPQPAHEDWPLSLVTESAAMRHQGRTDSRVHSPGSADLGTLFLPRLWGKLRKFQRSRNNKQCCLSTNVQNWPKITLNGKWLFLGSVSRKIKSPALISM